jgi:hypothetical protein
LFKLKRKLFRLLRWLAGYRRYSFKLSDGRRIACWTKTAERAQQIASEKEAQIRRDRIMQILDAKGTEQLLNDVLLTPKFDNATDAAAALMAATPNPITVEDVAIENRAAAKVIAIPRCVIGTEENYYGL